MYSSSGMFGDWITEIAQQRKDKSMAEKQPHFGNRIVHLFTQPPADVSPEVPGEDAPELYPDGYRNADGSIDWSRWESDFQNSQGYW